MSKRSASASEPDELRPGPSSKTGTILTKISHDSLKVNRDYVVTYNLKDKKILFFGTFDRREQPNNDYKGGLWFRNIRYIPSKEPRDSLRVDIVDHPTFFITTTHIGKLPKELNMHISKYIKGGRTKRRIRRKSNRR